MSLKLNEFVNFANSLADIATKTSMQYFRNKLNVENKDDESPVTIADKETEKLERELAKGKGLISRFFDWLSEPKTIAGKSRQKQKEIDKRIDELLEKKFKG